MRDSSNRGVSPFQRFTEFELLKYPRLANEANGFVVAFAPMNGFPSVVEIEEGNEEQEDPILNMKLDESDMLFLAKHWDSV